MKTIYFFKTHSRLGLLNAALYSGQENTGVEFGPDAVLSEEFLKRITVPFQVENYHFPLPVKIKKTEYEKVLTHTLSQFCELINKTLRPNETQVIVGGDHSVGFSSLLAVAKRFNLKDVGFILFDSHGEIHSFKSTPSGNFHGMWLRPFIDDARSKTIQKLISQKLPVRNLLYIGNLTLEKEEQDFIKKHKIRNINRQEIRQNLKAIKRELRDFISLFRHIHISFDIDVFDKSQVKATGTPSQNGLFKKDVFPLLKILSNTSSLSIDLVEVNPKKIGAAETVKLAQDVLITLLKLV